MGEFLKEIKAERVRDVRFQDMTNIIVLHAMDESKLQLCIVKFFTSKLQYTVTYPRVNIDTSVGRDGGLGGIAPPKL